MRIPFDVFTLEKENISLIENSINFLNSCQNSFKYNLISFDKIDETYFPKPSIMSNQVFDYANLLKEKLRGYHPYMIGVTNKYLYSEEILNLFGSAQKIESHYTGKGAISLFDVNEILKDIPLQTYIQYMITSGTTRVLANGPNAHFETKHCMFDMKMNKVDIIDEMKYGNFCLDCYRQIRRIVDDEQMDSLRTILRLISNVCCADDPLKKYQELYKQFTKKENQLVNNSDFQNILKLSINEVRETKLKKAVEIIVDSGFELKPEESNELTLIYSRINKLEYEERSAIIQADDKNREYNNIAKTILKLIQELKENYD